MIEIPVWGILCAIGVPSGITGLLVWRLEKRIDKSDKKRDEKEANRIEFELNQMRLSSAAIALGEATAKAVQRLPDAHCNGDMTKALDYAAQTKHASKDFLEKVGISTLFEVGA